MHPSFISKAIQEMLDKRNTVQAEGKDEDYIEMLPEIYEAIVSDKWLSK